MKIFASGAPCAEGAFAASLSAPLPFRPMPVRPHLLCVLLALAAFAPAAEPTTIRLSREDLRDRIHAFWIGQIAGNYIGFPFENLYTEQPLPVLVDRYYDFRDADATGLRMNLDDRRAYIRIMADAFGGAWSDDDTDVELVTLHAVERHGLDLTYAQLTEFWIRHINRFVWSATRVARDLMDQGHLPPATGSRALNPHWYSLSSQLKNEIWGVFYAGMPRAAVQRVEWDARIMNDGWAVHPDLVYGAIVSAAFHEKDPRRLVEFGASFLPADSPYKRGIDDLLRWHREHADWRVVRGLLHERYYREIDGFQPPVPYLGAIINGLCGLMALLYGEGDFTRTVGIATSAGYDCDNQAATCGGIVGIMHGTRAIPEKFTHELPSRGRWQEPFNDTYINYSRDDLPPHFRIGDLVDRILAVTERAIFEQGGRRIAIGGEPGYEIPFDSPAPPLSDDGARAARVPATAAPLSGRPLIDAAP